MRQDIRVARVGPPAPPSLRLEFADNGSKDFLLVNCVGLTILLFHWQRKVERLRTVLQDLFSPYTFLSGQAASPMKS
jgi:hypothetical protein